MKTLLPVLLLALACHGPAGAGQVLCHFDDSRDADVNTFGDRAAAGDAALTQAGTGSPARPQGRALDAGQAGGTPRVVEIPVSPRTSFAQGTVEAWVNTRWDWTDRGHHAFVFQKMEGGYWNSLSLYHHGSMGAEGALAFNIHDGVDNCVMCPVSQLGWKQGEWHHVAASWTEHSEWLYADGRLVARRVLDRPMDPGAPTGPLRIGSPGLFGGAAAALIDEVRLSDQPLYVGLPSIAVPRAPLPGSLPASLLSLPGTRIRASSTAPPLETETDVPAFHDGKYGEATRIDRPADAWVRADLPQVGPVSGVRWSRDGRPLKGPDAWADARLIPRDFRIEVSADGREWQAVFTRTDHYYDAGRIPREGMRFEHRFSPVPAGSVRMVVTRGQAGSPGVALDEFQVLDGSGRPVAPSKVVTALTRLRREYAPEKAGDGRLGDESCWRAAAPGEAWLEVSIAKPLEAKAFCWSRSAEGLQRDGTPSVLAVEARVGGGWQEVGRASGNTDPGRHTLALKPVTASEFRVRILATVDGKEPVLDEIHFE